MIDQRLIVTAAGLVNLSTKPVKNLVIQADGDPALAARGRNHRASSALTEIVFLFFISLLRIRVARPV